MGILDHNLTTLCFRQTKSFGRSPSVIRKIFSKFVKPLRQHYGVYMSPTVFCASQGHDPVKVCALMCLIDKIRRPRKKCQSLSTFRPSFSRQEYCISTTQWRPKYNHCSLSSWLLAPRPLPLISATGKDSDHSNWCPRRIQIPSRTFRSLRHLRTRS